MKNIEVVKFSCVLCKKPAMCIQFPTAQETINQSLDVVKVIYTHLCKDCIKQMYNQIKQK